MFKDLKGNIVISSSLENRSITELASEEVKFNLLFCVCWKVKWQEDEVGLSHPKKCFFQMLSCDVLLGCKHYINN